MVKYNMLADDQGHIILLLRTKDESVLWRRERV